MKKRKGQWLLITALIFSISISTIVIMTSNTEDITDISYGSKEMFENIKKESQNTINVIISENYTDEHLTANLKIYIEFLRQYANEHNKNISGFYMIGMPYNDGLNITVANFKGTPIKNLNLSIGSNHILNLHMDNNNFTTFHFPSIPNSFEFRYNFTYSNENNNNIYKNDTLTTRKRVFSILDLKMEEKNDIWTDYQIN